MALGVLETMARGPLARGARARLRAACAAAWRARSLCEAPSLTHHPCIEPDQSVPVLSFVARDESSSALSSWTRNKLVAIESTIARSA